MKKGIILSVILFLLFTAFQVSAQECSPVDAVISSPFTYDGAGDLCWEATCLGDYINCWNLSLMSINGVDFTNGYVSSSQYPAPVNGVYYIRYVASYPWSHIELVGACGAVPTDPPDTPAPTTAPTETPSVTPVPGVGDVSMSPSQIDVTQGNNVSFDILVNSGSQVVAAYGITITYNSGILGYVNCVAGSQGFLSAVNPNTPGEIVTSGFDATGTGPSSSLHLLTVTLSANNTGTSSIGINVDTLTDAGTNVIGSPNGIGGSITVNPGDTEAPTTAPTATPVVTTAPTDPPPEGVGDVSMSPSYISANEGDSVSFNIMVNSGSQRLAAYGIDISYNSGVLSNPSVAAGADGFVSAINTNTAGLIVTSGFDATGTGPGENLELLIISMTAQNDGTSSIGITVNQLVDESTDVIGTPNGIGGTIDVSGTVTAVPTAVPTVVPTAVPTDVPGPAGEIFSDNFDDGSISDWTVDGSAGVYSYTPANGSYCVRCRSTGSITRTVSTAGYSGIVVDFNLGGYSYSTGEYMAAEYNTGSGWVEIAQIPNGQDDRTLRSFSINLPAAADNNSNLQIRFVLHTDSTRDYGYVDDVVVTGGGGTTPTETPVVTTAPTATPVITTAPTATPVITAAPTATPVVTTVPTTAPTEPPTGELVVLDQNLLSVTYVDSEELSGEDGAATNAIDGDTSTIWHTEWQSSSPSHPHEIQLSLGGTYSVGGLRYLPRQTSTLNGTIADYEIYVGSTLVASGTWAANNSEKEVQFNATSGSSIRLVALSEINGNPWTSAAEINILVYSGTTPTDAPTTAPTATPVVTAAPTETPVSTAVPTDPPPDGAGDVTMSPSSISATAGDSVSFSIMVNSGNQRLAAYGIDISYNSGVLGNPSVAAGADGFVSAINTNTAGLIVTSGFDATGTGPGTNLEVLIITLDAQNAGTSSIGITVNQLVDENTTVIGTPNGSGGTVTVDPAPTETPVVTAAPTETPVVTAAPTETPVVTAAPTETPVVTAAPTETPVPTAAPTETPVVTAAPTETPVPTAVPTDPPPVYTAGSMWLVPDSLTISGSGTTEVHCHTGSQTIAAYGTDFYYNSSIITVNSGDVAAGADGFVSALNYLDGQLVTSGFDATGRGPGDDLHLLTITWTAVNSGTSTIDVDVRSFVDASTQVVGTPTGWPGSITVN